MVLPRDVCWSVNPVTYFGIPKYLNLATVIKIDTVYKYIYKTQLPISINNGLALSIYIYTINSSWNYWHQLWSCTNLVISWGTTLQVPKQRHPLCLLMLKYLDL